VHSKAYVNNNNVVANQRRDIYLFSPPSRRNHETCQEKHICLVSKF